MPVDERRQEEVHGVFVVNTERPSSVRWNRNHRLHRHRGAERPAETGDQIIIGSYKAIRTIRNAARVKVDNRAAGSSDRSRAKADGEGRGSRQSWSAASSSGATGSSSAPGI